LNIFALISIAVILRLTWISDKWFNESQSASFDQIAQKVSNQSEQLLQKVDLIYRSLHDTLWITSQLLVCVAIFGGIVGSYLLATLLLELVNEDRPSFVVLTRRAELDHEQKIKKYENSWKKFSIGFTTAITAGVLGNVVTWLIFT
jgi:hypothetical protein